MTRPIAVSSAGGIPLTFWRNCSSRLGLIPRLYDRPRGKTNGFVGLRRMTSSLQLHTFCGRDAEGFANRRGLFGYSDWTVRTLIDMLNKETDRGIPIIFAAACLVAASICVSAGYIIPALLLSGMHFADNATADAAFHYDLRYSSGLLVIACVLGFAALVFGAWAVLRRRPAL